jgi:hypothetical protein
MLSRFPLILAGASMEVYVTSTRRATRAGEERSLFLA